MSSDDPNASSRPAEAPDADDASAADRDEPQPTHEDVPSDDDGGKKWLFVALGVLAVGIVGFVLLLVLSPSPPTQEPPPQTPLVEAVRAEVRSGRLVVTGNGSVETRAAVDVAPGVGGRVVYVNPSLVTGGRVQEGEVLFRIEQADFANAVESARAEVAQAEVEVLRAEQERAVAAEELARLDRRLRAEGARGVRPYEGDFVPREGDRSDRPLDPGLDADSLGASALARRLPQLRAAEAALQGARARLEDAQLGLGRTVVRAPFTARVRSESVDIGQYVAPGQTVAQVYAADAAEVVVPLADDAAALLPDLWALDAGDGSSRLSAVVSTDYGGERFQWVGYVDRARTVIDPQTRTIDVVVRVPDPDRFGTPVPPEPLRGDGYGEPERVRTSPTGAVPIASRPPLLIGMYTTVEIEGAYVDRYVVLPRAALRDGDAVWTVRQDSLLVMEPVEVIQQVEDRVFVSAPSLDPQTLVITSDIAVVTDSMTVRLARRTGERGGSGAAGGAAGQ